MTQISKNLFPTDRKIIFLIGYMGSGKSYWGKKWALANNYQFIDLDTIIEEHEGKSVAEIFDTKGENYFRKMETFFLHSFNENNHVIFATGGGTPCFNDNLNWMNEHGVTIYLKASPQQLLMRLIHEKEKRPLLKNIEDENLEAFISKRLFDREEFYLQAKIILNVDSVKESTFSEIVSKP